MRLAPGGIVSLLVLALVPAADAAQRYAAPAGAGTTCSAAVPCSLKEAITKAKTGDEVIVTAGSYSVEEATHTGPGVKGVDVHGVPGGPPPKIVGAVNGTLIAVGEEGDSLSYLDVTNTGSEYASAVACSVGDHVEQLRATASGANASAIVQYADCLVRDSLALATGPDSSGLFSSSYEGYEGVARNLTAIATGAGSAGVRGSTLIIAGAQSHALDLKNTIASGTEADLRATANSTYEVAVTITVSNSNFDAPVADPEATISDGGGNQAVPPLFVDAANGDYREAGGSPTIDAGAIDPQISPADLLGGPRVVGGAPDIGAYEFVPPPEPPLAPGQIQSMRVSPSTFRTVNVGGAIFSAKGKAKAPVGATVAYGLSAPAAVQFTVERKVSGRKAGKRCVKKTRANKGKKKCALYKPIKGGFAHSGATGQNTFKFSGRIGGKSLKPGRFELVGGVGGSIKRAAFRIVK
jgi:hypothetical protein